MRASLCLTFLAVIVLVSSNAADAITDGTSNFFIGEWYSVNFTVADVADKECCIPYGKVTFRSTSSKSLNLTANSWAGKACSELSITPKSELIYSTNADTTYSALADVLSKKNLFSSSGVKSIKISIKDLHLDTIHANSTQNVNFELSLGGFMSGKDSCSVILSKAGTPNITAEAAKQAGIPTKKTVSADDLSDFDEFELLEGIFKEVSERYSLRSKFLSYDN